MVVRKYYHLEPKIDLQFVCFVMYLIVVLMFVALVLKIGDTLSGGKILTHLCFSSTQNRNPAVAKGFSLCLLCSSMKNHRGFAVRRFKLFMAIVCMTENSMVSQGNRMILCYRGHAEMDRKLISCFQQ